MQRGEITLRAGRKPVRLVLGFNALCALEAETGKTIEQLIAFSAMPESGQQLQALRALIWAGMLADQPEATLCEAGDLVDSLGAVNACDHVLDLLQAGGYVEKPEAKSAAKALGKNVEAESRRPFFWWWRRIFAATG